MTQSPVYIARPTIRINEDAYALLNELLLGMRMTESEGGLSALELRFSNWASDTTGGANYAFEDGDILALGAAISVYAGDERSPQRDLPRRHHRAGSRLPAADHPRSPSWPRTRLQRLRLARRSKTYENVSIADIANQIAQAGIQANVDGFEDTSGVYVQMKRERSAFLRRPLARYDGDLQIVGDELHIAPRGNVRR
ncbi:MAG: hypothetical protein R2856_32605 [Caldilineaceae bacterium]